ncbi:MAG: NAD(P)H-hydrate dehydratase [Nitrososphaeria archaeon]
MKVSSVEQMEELDSVAVEKYGIEQKLLMENAGHAVYSVIQKELSVFEKKFVIIAGTGNNGGDALVAARKLRSSGAKVKAFVIGDPSKFSGAALKNYQTAQKMGIVAVVDEKGGIDYLRLSLSWCDAVVDGLFGTGLSGEISGIYRDVIEEVNKVKKPVFSVDIPSGIGGNDGKAHGTAIKACCTITFGLPKLGNVLYPGFHYGGKLYVSHISFPPELYNTEKIKVELNEPPEIPDRLPWGHKGTFGKLLVVAGARNYYGAPYFSSLSFLKAGGGYSRLAAPKSIIPYIASKASEVVYLPMEENENGSLSFSNKRRILELIEQLEIDFAIFGPGVSTDNEAQSLIRVLVSEADIPVIVDGDGLTAISADTSILKSRKKPTILTPHSGEMARLMKIKTEEIESKRVEIATIAAKDLNAFVVLKGAHSIIAYPDGREFINMSGNSGMATAGSGDVLTGTVAAMIGLGLQPGEALRTGVFIHGLSGDIAASVKGEDGITAEDILQNLPEAVRVYRKDRGGVLKKYMPEVI